MALIVDAAGKVTANPKTGKINRSSSSSSGGGAKASAGRSGSSKGSGNVDYEDEGNELAGVTGSTRSSRRSTPSGNRLSYQVGAPSASVVSAPSSPMREHEVGRDKPTSYWDDVQNDSLDIAKKIDERMRASEEADEGSVPDTMMPSFMRTGSAYGNIGASAPEGMASSSGGTVQPVTIDGLLSGVYESTLRPMGIDMDRESESGQWEREQAEREGRDVRTQNYWGEDYRADGGGVLSSIDSQLDMIGNTQSNDAYLRAAIDDGADPDEMYDIMHRNQLAALSLPWGLGSDQRNSVDQGGLLAGSAVIDDGTYDYDHMTADNMTGTQYLKYAQMGMGGRPVNEIDPLQVYSKRRELVNYGFVPFTPDETSYANMVLDNAADFPARLGAEIGSLRTKIPGLDKPYKIHVGDKEVDGPEFDKLGGAYIHQTEWKNQFDPSVLEFPIPDKDGNMTYHYGYLDSVIDYGDGFYELGFTDGSTVEVDQDFYDSVSDGNGNVSLNDYEPVTASDALGNFPEITDENRYDLITIPDLVMPDGTTLTFDEAQDVYYDHDIGDDPNNKYDNDITYDISKSIIPTLDNRPSRLNGEIFGEGMKPNLDSLANNVVDWTLGSVPISVTSLFSPISGAPLFDLSAFPWLYSASNASSSLAGVDPGTYDIANDSYGLGFGNYDSNGNLRYGIIDADGNINREASDEARFWNALGNASVPLTEQIVGPVGEYGLPVRKLLNIDLPTSPTYRDVLADLAMGAFEEGVEEDLGNIFDELTNYGPRGMFTNQAVDDSGMPMYDVTGHEIRDYSTSTRDRLANLGNVEDLANAFTGGAAVDLAMQSNPLMPGNVWSNLGNVRYNNELRRNLGIDRYVDPRETRRQKVSEDYLSQFNNDI